MAHRVVFRYRAHEVTRLEAFSDVIFGFALSLIVVSLEAPKTYGELMETLRGILSFGFCFLIFMFVLMARGILGEPVRVSVGERERSSPFTASALRQ